MRLCVHKGHWCTRAVAASRKSSNDIPWNTLPKAADRLFRAEKRGWASAPNLIKIRELRNLISHEYAADKMQEIFAAVAALTPLLLALVPRVKAYAQSVIQRYPK